MTHTPTLFYRCPGTAEPHALLTRPPRPSASGAQPAARPVPRELSGELRAADKLRPSSGSPSALAGPQPARGRSCSGPHVPHSRESQSLHKLTACPDLAGDRRAAATGAQSRRETRGRPRGDHVPSETSVHQRQPGAIRVFRLPQSLLHLLRPGQTQTAAVRVAVSEILQLQVLRQGVREPGRSEDAHPHTHTALCV